MTTTLEATLAHYGVKGMKWGSRKSADAGPGPASGVAPPKASADAKNAEKLAVKVKTGSTKALSNQELEALTKRMRLETQYKELASKSEPITAKQAGAAFAKNLLAQTVKQQVGTVANQYASQQVKKMMQNAA